MVGGHSGVVVKMVWFCSEEACWLTTTRARDAVDELLFRVTKIGIGLINMASSFQSMSLLSMRKKMRAGKHDAGSFRVCAKICSVRPTQLQPA
jgi:hypothetical protein